MRIAYLTCVYPPYPGGIGIVAQGMAREMTARGHQAQVFAPFHPFRPLLRFGNAAFLPQLLWRLRGFDIVHVLYPFYGAAELVPFLKRTTSAKIVVHHLMDAVDTGWRGKVFKLHSKYIMPRIFRAADRVVALSEDYWQNCELEKLGLKNVDIVPNGVDVELFQPAPHPNPLPRGEGAAHLNPSPSGLPAQAGRGQGEGVLPTILFVGGLDRAHYFKGVEVLIEACRILRERGIKFRCQIVGEGEMRGEYERKAKVSGVRGQVSGVDFLGLVPHDQLPAYYQQAAVCVVPSTARIECFSIVAAEAQACGIPAIVSDFPGVRVTVENGKTGYVVRPKDPEALALKIQELVENPQKAKQLGAAGRTRVERLYSWKVVGDKLENIYARCYNSPNY